MFRYDSQILAAVGQIPRSVPDVIGILETIDAVCADSDGLKWFNWTYLRVTRAIQNRVFGGGFADPAWLAELDIQFARLYFSALRSWLSGEREPEPVPDCWKALLTARGDAGIAKIQFALAGINAHINRDLPEAILAACQATGTLPEREGPHYADFVAINTMLDNLIQSVKTTLAVQSSHLADAITEWNVVAARESAWKNAERLHALRKIPQLGEGFIAMLDGVATALGKTLLTPMP